MLPKSALRFDAFVRFFVVVVVVILAYFCVVSIGRSLRRPYIHTAMDGLRKSGSKNEIYRGLSLLFLLVLLLSLPVIRSLPSGVGSCI